MENPKCVYCNRRFHYRDEIMTVDNIHNHVHVYCHYNYLSSQHLNSIYSLKELKEALKEDE
ncbi:hypothetical protein CHH83_02285 [Bacillus sp. 7586-K]|nr:hypothetical protein CHH83_02285 [Bacillus sp. 7586-K]